MFWYFLHHTHKLTLTYQPNQCRCKACQPPWLPFPLPPISQQLLPHTPNPVSSPRPTFYSLSGPGPLLSLHWRRLLRTASGLPSSRRRRLLPRRSRTLLLGPMGLLLLLLLRFRVRRWKFKVVSWIRGGFPEHGTWSSFRKMAPPIGILLLMLVMLSLPRCAVSLS